MINSQNDSHVRIVLSALHHSLHMLCESDIAKLTIKVEKILIKDFSPPLKLLATNLARILRGNKTDWTDVMTHESRDSIMRQMRCKSNDSLVLAIYRPYSEVSDENGFDAFHQKQNN